MSLKDLFIITRQIHVPQVLLDSLKLHPSSLGTSLSVIGFSSSCALSIDTL